MIHTYVLTDVFTSTENVLNLLRSDLKELIEEENHDVINVSTNVNEKMNVNYHPRPGPPGYTLRSKMSENLNILDWWRERDPKPGALNLTFIVVRYLYNETRKSLLHWSCYKQPLFVREWISNLFLKNSVDRTIKSSDYLP